MVKQNMALTYSGNITRQHDPDRFLLSLLVPACHRPALWALFAFNYEIAKTREVVSETTIGLIRLQWWRDAIGEIYDGKTPREHEIVQALAVAIQSYNLPRELFDKLIYAREFDLEGVAPANLEGLYNYCDYTSTPLFKIVSLILQEGHNDTDIADIAGYYALIGVLRAVPYMLSRRQIMLPQDILQQYNLSEQKLFDFKQKEEISKVIKEILNKKQAFRYDKNKIKSKFFKGALTISNLYRHQIESCHYDVFDSRMVHAPRFMALRVWFSSVT